MSPNNVTDHWDVSRRRVIHLWTPLAVVSGTALLTSVHSTLQLGIEATYQAVGNKPYSMA